jgi:hypothetical protein
METEREPSLKSLNELLGVFMRQVAVEGEARGPAVRRSSSAPMRSARRRHPEAKRHD